MRKERIGKIVATSIALLLCANMTPTVFASEGGFSVEDLTLQPGGVVSEINLNWYADANTTDAKVKFTVDDQTINADATEKEIDINNDQTMDKTVCKATVTGLAANTTYKYEISNDGGSTWSKDYSYTTPNKGNFKFAFVGDPQLNTGNEDANSNAFSSDKTTKTGWSDTISAIATKGVNFIASAGDQVDNTNGNEAEYTDFFSPTQLQSIPFAAAAGNHDRNSGFLTHYNLPNEQDVSELVNSQTTAAATEVTTDKGNYYYSYNNSLFVVLNDSSYPASKEEAEPYIAAFRKTLEAAVSSNSNYTWLFVQHHKSTESVAQHVADTDIEYYVEAGFEDLMDEFNVDFVLAGHDHVYARSYAMNNGKRVSDLSDSYENPDGTIYLTCNTGSGLKYYNIFDSQKLYVKDNVNYPYLANGLKGSAEYLKGVYPLSTAVADQSKIPGYTMINVDGNTVSFKTYSTYDNPQTGNVDEATESVDSFTVTKSSTPATKVSGIDNGTASVTAELKARYDSNVSDEDGGTTEIVEFNTENNCAYAVNGKTGNLVKIDLSNVSANDTSVKKLSAIHIPVKEIVEANATDFSYGDMTSIAIDTANDQIVVAVQSSDYTKNGKIVLLDYDGNFKSVYEAGVQPDMITVDSSTNTILTANEGEPREGSSGTNPKGSITIVSNNTATTIDFTSFDSKRDELTAAGVVLQKNTQPSVDLEPEYISVTDGKAYVSLQESNAIGVLDINSQTVTGIYSVGVEDYSKVAIDLGNGDDKYEGKTYNNLYGLRMPDGITSYTKNGKTYLVTANEGDARDWSDDIANEIKGKTSPNKDITTNNKVTYFNTSLYDGVDSSKNYLFGGRSFTVFQVTDNGLKEVYDSGSDFETITGAALPNNFNCSNNNTDIDDRSGKKGCEPENVTLGTINGKAYAFVALERIGGIMAYDVTEPSKSTYVNYINSRDFSQSIAGDVSPEGLCFVDSQSSPSGTPLLLAANEVSGTVSVIEYLAKSSGGSSIGGGSTLTPTVSLPTGVSTVDGNSDLTLTKNDNGNTIEAIKNGSNILIKDKDYTLTDKTIVISKAYLKSLSNGAHTISVVYKNGTTVNLTIEVKKTEDSIQSPLLDMKIKLKSKLTSKGVKLEWTVTGIEGKVDGYEVYRSTKKSSGYGTKAYFKTTSTKYTNTKELKKGKTLHYKVRAYKTVDGVKYYSKWSTKAWRTIK